MDVLSDLLRRARAGTTEVRQLVRRPPWSLTFAESGEPGLITLLASLGGPAHLRSGGRGWVLPAGGLALVKGAGGYTVADSAETPAQVVIADGRKHVLGEAGSAARQRIGPRTYGDGLPGATTLVRGTCALHGDVGERLLELLPPVVVVPAGERTGAALALLTAEAARDEPGQDAVLHRLVDLVLVLALRAWSATSGEPPPGWYHALADRHLGRALRALHEEPARRWTVAALAAEAGLSRAAFAARFRAAVGRPPLTYLTDWRMTLAADALRDTGDTVAVVARQVGYDDAFAFSVAFKRARGETPSAWRRRGGGVAVTP
ncbi:AraC family transcriptional regulator [Amycolatopsis sp. NPDC049252]|uniref:AraC family transcriptional regulator n=1 Tax=Amycolatopsis sp. NPDC049252 TaxID=3363933 RepID=UPI00370FC001